MTFRLSWTTGAVGQELPRLGWGPTMADCRALIPLNTAEMKDRQKTASDLWAVSQILQQLTAVVPSSAPTSLGAVAHPVSHGGQGGAARGPARCPNSPPCLPWDQENDLYPALQASLSPVTSGSQTFRRSCGSAFSAPREVLPPLPREARPQAVTSVTMLHNSRVAYLGDGPFKVRGGGCGSDLWDKLGAGAGMPHHPGTPPAAALHVLVCLLPALVPQHCQRPPGPDDTRSSSPGSLALTDRPSAGECLLAPEGSVAGAPGRAGQADRGHHGAETRSRAPQPAPQDAVHSLPGVGAGGAASGGCPAQRRAHGLSGRRQAEEPRGGGRRGAGATRERRSCDRAPALRRGVAVFFEPPNWTLLSLRIFVGGPGLPPPGPHPLSLRPCPGHGQATATPWPVLLRLRIPSLHFLQVVSPCSCGTFPYLPPLSCFAFPPSASAPLTLAPGSSSLEPSGVDGPPSPPMHRDRAPVTGLAHAPSRGTARAGPRPFTYDPLCTPRPVTHLLPRRAAARTHAAPRVHVAGPAVITPKCSCTFAAAPPLVQRPFGCPHRCRYSS